MTGQRCQRPFSRSRRRRFESPEFDGSIIRSGKDPISLNIDGPNPRDVTVKQFCQRQGSVAGDGDDADGHVVAAGDDPRRREDDVVNGGSVMREDGDQSETFELLARLVDVDLPVLAAEGHEGGAGGESCESGRRKMF